MKGKVIYALTLAVLLSLSLFPTATLAGNAVLYLSPGSGTKYVGAVFSVAVKVNSGSHSTNAYKVVLTFPTDKLRVTSYYTGSSICDLWIPPSPTYSNTQGRVTFECGHTGAFTGSAGTIGNVTFSVKAAGTARVSFTSASAVKAADGSGTEVLGSTGVATFTLKTIPVSAPVVSSTTHPNQKSWYAIQDAKLSWTKPPGSNGFSYTLNSTPKTIPNNSSQGTGAKRTYRDLSGIQYFHIKARGANGWGSTAHFRIQVDTTPPDPFEVTSDPSAENVTSAPLISATATDRPSGIDHYELSLDGGAFETVQIPYKFERIQEGVHTLTIRAVDRAGNYRDSSITLYVVDVQDPEILEPADKSTLPLLEALTIKGTAPVGLVEIYLNDELIAKVESDGEFEYTRTGFLRPGIYRLTAKAITEEGIESSPAEVTFTVDARAVSIFGVVVPGWVVYSLLFGIIISLFIFLILYWRKIRKIDEHIQEDLDKIEKTVEKQLKGAERDLDRAVEKILQDGNEAEMRRMEHALENRIEKESEEAREEIKKQLDKIRQHHRKKPSLLKELRSLKKLRLFKFFKRKTEEKAKEDQKAAQEKAKPVKRTKTVKRKKPKTRRKAR